MTLLKKGCFCCLNLKESMMVFAILAKIGAVTSIVGLCHMLFLQPIYYEMQFLKYFEYHHWKEFLIFLYVLFGISCYGVISTTLALVPTCQKVQMKKSRGYVTPFILYQIISLFFNMAVLVWSHFILKCTSPRLQNGILYFQILFTVWSLMVGISYYQWLSEKSNCSQWKATRIQQGPYRPLTEDLYEAPPKSEEKVAENLYFVM